MDWLIAKAPKLGAGLPAKRPKGALEGYFRYYLQVAYRIWNTAPRGSPQFYQMAVESSPNHYLERCRRRRNSSI